MPGSMIRVSRITTIVFAVLLTLQASCSRHQNIYDVAGDDPEMTAAIAKARGTLPQFWQVFEKPEHGESRFSLKVKIKDKDETEVFWTSEIERRDGKISGRISNNPEIVKTVKMGERIEIPEADITDWLYFRDGKMFGNETIRPLLKKMPPDRAAKVNEMLADP